MLLSILLAACPAVQSPVPATPTTQTETSALDELQLEFVLTPDGPRYYRTFVPDGATPDAELPLIVCFHGGGGNALQIAGQNGVLEQARRRGWMAVFPEGTGPLGGPPLFKLETWNVDICCGSAVEEGIDDVLFFERMLGKLSLQHPLDESRVFLTGMSNGAMMSYKIAVERPDLVAGIAPVAGALTTTPPVLPVPLLAIHGLLDEKVPFQGGVGTGVSGTNFPSQAESLVPFLAVGGLGGPAEVIAAPTYLLLQWSGKPTGAPTWYFLALDGGHTWPGGKPSPLPNPDPIHTDVPATSLMFHFFEQL